MRTALSLVYRSFLYMLVGAGLVVVAQTYGATLFARLLPEELRPGPHEVTKSSPQRIIDALGNIRGALE